MVSKLKVFISRKTTHFLEKFCISWTTTTCRKSRSVLRIVEKWKIYSHRNFFPSYQLFSDLFRKCVAFTKFLPKKHESKFPPFPHCVLQHGKMFDETHFLVECFEKFRQNVVKRTCSTLTKFPNKEFLLLTNDRYGPFLAKFSLMMKRSIIQEIGTM